MSDGLILYHLPPSPNNLRARLGLGVKGLSYEARPVGLGSDRAEIVEISGQPKLPVLVHGDVVIFDSGSILRYLETRFPDTPRLFSADYDEMGRIDDWEVFGRGTLQPLVVQVLHQAIGGKAPDEEVLAGARSGLAEATGRIEAALADADFLLGDRVTAADLFIAPYVGCATWPADAESPLVAFFGRYFALPAERTRTRAWVERVLAFEGAPALAT